MKVKELIDKLQKLNPEYDVKVVAYNENAQCSKKCNVTDAGEELIPTNGLTFRLADLATHIYYR